MLVKCNCTLSHYCFYTNSIRFDSVRGYVLQLLYTIILMDKINLKIWCGYIVACKYAIHTLLTSNPIITEFIKPQIQSTPPFTRLSRLWRSRIVSSVLILQHLATCSRSNLMWACMKGRRSLSCLSGGCIIFISCNRPPKMYTVGLVIERNQLLEAAMIYHKHKEYSVAESFIKVRSFMKWNKQITLW